MLNPGQAIGGGSEGNHFMQVWSSVSDEELVNDSLVSHSLHQLLLPTFHRASSSPTHSANSAEWLYKAPSLRHNILPSVLRMLLCNVNVH